MCGGGPARLSGSAREGGVHRGAPVDFGGLLVVEKSGARVLASRRGALALDALRCLLADDAHRAARRLPAPR